MSTTRQTDRQERPNRDQTNPPTCASCDAYRNPRKSVRGSYCSEACYFRHRGQKALKNLEDDHRFCRTCFAQVKEIEDPPQRAPSFVVGYQYGTDAATSAARDYDREDAARPLVKERLGCHCGATDLRSHDDVLATVDLERTLVNLWSALRVKHREDKVPDPDHSRLFAAYRETRDLEYAVGAGLYG